MGCLPARGALSRSDPSCGAPARPNKALLVAPSYLSQQAELPEAAAEAAACLDWLRRRQFAPPNHVRILAEDGKSHGLPTRAEVLHGLQWLVAGAQAGSSLFLFFGGHGVPDADGEHAELCPCDCATEGTVGADELGAAAAALPPGALLTVVCDLAHGGAPLRLRYSRTVEATRAREENVVVSEGSLPPHAERRGYAWQHGEGAELVILSADAAPGAEPADATAAGAFARALWGAADAAPGSCGGADAAAVLRGTYARLRSRRADQLPRMESTHPTSVFSLAPAPAAVWLEQCLPEQPWRPTWWRNLVTGDKRWGTPPGRRRGDVGAAPAEESSAPPPWREFRTLDGRLYYYNPQGGATSWRRPRSAEVTPAPPLSEAAQPPAPQVLSTFADAEPGGAAGAAPPLPLASPDSTLQVHVRAPSPDEAPLAAPSARSAGGGAGGAAAAPPAVACGARGEAAPLLRLGSAATQQPVPDRPAAPPPPLPPPPPRQCCQGPLHQVSWHALPPPPQQRAAGESPQPCTRARAGPPAPPAAAARRDAFTDASPLDPPPTAAVPRVLGAALRWDPACGARLSPRRPQHAPTASPPLPPPPDCM